MHLDFVMVDVNELFNKLGCTLFSCLGFLTRVSFT
jgi:hypothetical protein